MVFSVVRAETLLGNCVVTRLYNNRVPVFSVLPGPCRDIIREIFGKNSQLSVGKLVVEEALEVNLWRLNVSLEDLVTVRLF
jgi:hypothetical protein